VAEREEALLVEPPQAQAEEPEPKPDPAELAQLEAKLAELQDAQAAFARTQHELAARSDALSEREAEVANRERALEERADPKSTMDIEDLEARIRRLEQGGRTSPVAEQPTFSSGLRALQERGLRGRREPDEPLH
jgi:chromosome segregation ATPase